MTDPTFKKTAKIYFKKRFALDLVTTIISDVLFLTLFLQQSATVFSIAVYLKLLRILYLRKVRSSYTYMIRNLLTGPSYVRAVYAKFCDLLFFTFIIVHLLACLWIRIGLWDVSEPEGERQSWIFQKGTDFSDDSVMEEG